MQRAEAGGPGVPPGGGRDGHARAGAPEQAGGIRGNWRPPRAIGGPGGVRPPQSWGSLPQGRDLPPGGDLPQWGYPPNNVLEQKFFSICSTTFMSYLGARAT